MTTNVVFELGGVERVEGPTGDVTNGVVIDDWLAGEPGGMCLLMTLISLITH